MNRTAYAHARPMKPFFPRLLPLVSATLTAAAALVATGAQANPTTLVRGDAKRGEAVAQVCMACHTADGSRGAPANPIIAGQHPQYIVKQLQEFKAGVRPSPIMQGMAAPLTEQQMRDVAAFYASKKAPTGAARNKDTVMLGEKIYRGGIASISVPACSGCHSPNAAGIPSQYPRLGGQHAEYTDAQLKAFRAGTRPNSPQMTAIAARMSDKEIAAVADYIAGLR